MTDKGFTVQDLCASKGIFHNHPAMKYDDQFSQVDTADNFDISCLRIHVERYIGRDWSILNKVWPVQRMDLLYSYLVGCCPISDLFGKESRYYAEPNICLLCQINHISDKQLTKQLFYYSCPES